jgi:hypothetical protein
MTKEGQDDQLEELKTRVDALERALAVTIDVLKEEMEKTDSYGLFKRLSKWLSLDSMNKRLDDAKTLINSWELGGHHKRSRASPKRRSPRHHHAVSHHRGKSSRHVEGSRCWMPMAKCPCLRLRSRDEGQS